MNDRSKIQLHTNSVGQQSQIIDFVKRNGKNSLEIRQGFSILLLFFTILGLPSTAFAKDTYSSHAIAKQNLDNHQSLIKDNTKGIFISQGWEQEFTQQQQEWAEQQRQAAEQFAQQQGEWAERQRQTSEQFTQQQREWAEQQHQTSQEFAEQQRRASEQFTQQQQEWAEQQRQAAEQFAQQQREWGQRTGQKWEWQWEWETRF